MNSFLLEHEGWKRWTHAIGSGEQPQCISIYVCANLMKLEAIGLIERMGRKTHSTHTYTHTHTRQWVIERHRLSKVSNYSEKWKVGSDKEGWCMSRGRGRDYLHIHTRRMSPEEASARNSSTKHFMKYDLDTTITVCTILAGAVCVSSDQSYFVL